jgi:hypothetical protein
MRLPGETGSRFGLRSGRSAIQLKFMPLPQPFSNNSSATELIRTPTAAHRAMELLTNRQL